MKNFVGRNVELQDLKQRLECNEEKNVIAITGGPGYGKSSLAITIGHEMLEQGYNQVLWINIQAIANDNVLDEVALKILEGLNADISEIKGDSILYLNRVLQNLTKLRKNVLLIYDNADVIFQSDGLLQQLSELMLHKAAKAICTTRICQSANFTEDQILTLGPLTDAGCYEYLSQVLDLDLNAEDQAILDSKLSKLSQGLPFALEIITSLANKLRDKEKIDVFFKALESIPVEAGSKANGCLSELFMVLLKMLQEEEVKLLLMLPVFRSTFSYDYVIKLSEFLELNPTAIDQLQLCSLVSGNASAYHMHPFLREFLIDNIWDAETKRIHEEAFYRVYLERIFELARDSLKKDTYVASMEEFQKEKENFLYVMLEVAKGCRYRAGDFSSEIFMEVLKKPSSDYICVMLFYLELTTSSLLLNFFKGCEEFASERMKKNIWCCRNDIYYKYFEQEIEDPYPNLEPDIYGCVLIQRRSVKSEVWNDIKYTAERFHYLDDSLKRFMGDLESLDDKAIRSYFMHKMLKDQATLYKKASHILPFGKSKKIAITIFLQALEICKTEFGSNWLTIDCYNQLGKTFWKYKEVRRAMEAFDAGIAMAEAMSLTSNRRFIGSCLLDKGRFLVDVMPIGTKHSIEGAHLLEKVLKDSEAINDSKLWFLAIDFLVRVDPAKQAELVNKFLETKKLKFYTIRAMNWLVKEKFKSVNKGSAAELKMVSEHLNNLCQISEENHSLLAYARCILFNWNKEIAIRCNKTLPDKDRKLLALSALELLKRYDVYCNKSCFEKLVQITKN